MSAFGTTRLLSPKADLNNDIKMDKFCAKGLLPRSPGLKTASLGLPHFVKCQNHEHWRATHGADSYRTCACKTNGLHGLSASGAWGRRLSTQLPFHPRIIIFQTPHLLPRIDLEVREGRFPKGTCLIPPADSLAWHPRPALLLSPGSQAGNQTNFPGTARHLGKTTLKPT